jgi:predicted nuclease of predicted toxin-antitoxin system
MKIVVDMNLSPAWCTVLRKYGFEAIHWSSIGDPKATDKEIFLFARNNNHVILTHNLDFSVILANTQAASPSVIQLRTQDTLPEKNSTAVIASLHKYKHELAKGAIITIDIIKSRVRILPI